MTSVGLKCVCFSKKTFAKWSFAEKAPLFRQGLCRMPQMQGAESEGEGSVLTHMTKPESRNDAADGVLCKGLMQRKTLFLLPFDHIRYV